MCLYIEKEKVKSRFLTRIKVEKDFLEKNVANQRIDFLLTLFRLTIYLCLSFDKNKMSQPNELNHKKCMYRILTILHVFGKENKP